MINLSRAIKHHPTSSIARLLQKNVETKEDLSQVLWRTFFVRLNKTVNATELRKEKTGMTDTKIARAVRRNTIHQTKYAKSSYQDSETRSWQTGLLKE
jgi:hypothetical protein